MPKLPSDALLMATKPKPSPNVVCRECDGTTWTRTVRDGVERVFRCQCYRDEWEHSALESARVPNRYLECAFDARSGGKPFDRLQPSLARAHKIAESWAERFPDVEAGLLFSGPPGAGKTHLAVAILRRILIERGIEAQALFASFRGLLREIKGSYHPDTRITESDVLRPILTAEPLVLDELGGESPTLWVFDTLFYILDYRYSQGKLTIITTNFSDATSGRSSRPMGRSASLGGNRSGLPDETLSDRITVRLRSRLYEMCRDIHISGDDYRHSTLQANFKE